MRKTILWIRCRSGTAYLHKASAWVKAWEMVAFQHALVSLPQAWERKKSLCVKQKVGCVRAAALIRRYFGAFRFVFLFFFFLNTKGMVRWAKGRASRVFRLREFWDESCIMRRWIFAWIGRVMDVNTWYGNFRLWKGYSFFPYRYKNMGSSFSNCVSVIDLQGGSCMAGDVSCHSLLCSPSH